MIEGYRNLGRIVQAQSAGLPVSPALCYGTLKEKALQVKDRMMIAQKLVCAARKAAVLVAFGAPLAVCGAALALDCNEDIAKLTKKRQGVIDQLNHQSKGAKNQLDPVAACPKLRALVAAENELVSYLTKNKEWCSVPDEALANINASSSKSSTVANQACKVAAQMKKAQQQQSAGALNAPPGQKLPTGPL
jgi:hypothetical protein